MSDLNIIYLAGEEYRDIFKLGLSIQAPNYDESQIFYFDEDVERNKVQN